VFRFSLSFDPVGKMPFTTQPSHHDNFYRGEKAALLNLTTGSTYYLT
jgi:hypothetical protein